jgi:hypothetical protein
VRSSLSIVLAYCCAVAAVELTGPWPHLNWPAPFYFKKVNALEGGSQLDDTIKPPTVPRSLCFALAVILRRLAADDRVCCCCSVLLPDFGGRRLFTTHGPFFFPLNAVKRNDLARSTRKGRVHRLSTRSVGSRGEVLENLFGARHRFSYYLLIAQSIQQ